MYFYILHIKSMKNFKLLTLLWVAFIAGTLAGCWNKDNEGDFIIEDITSENEAVINYNDNLVDLASKCLASEDTIWTTYNDANSTTDDIISAINNTISECSNTSDEINKLWDWEGDNSLKSWILDIIEKEINYYTKFSELLPYLEKEDLSDEEKADYDVIYAEVETLDKELSDANDNLLVVQEQFAKNHWFELEEPAEETTEETAE
jgi:hypothetical protein